MGGNFPALGAASSGSCNNSGSHTKKGGGGAWGTAKAAPSKGGSVSTSGPSSDTMARSAGTPASAPSALGPPRAPPHTSGSSHDAGAGDAVTAVSDTAAVGAGGSGSKKPKKTKIVLMSNAG